LAQAILAQVILARVVVGASLKRGMAMASSHRARHRARPAGCAEVAALLLFLALRCRPRTASPGASDAGFAVLASNRRGSPAARLCAEGAGAGEDASATWRSAYELELERNGLLRDQLRSVDPAAPEARGQPEECALDWEENYARLRACNEALEGQLRTAQGGLGAASPQTELSEEELDARLPVVLDVKLEHRMTKIEVFRRHGAGSTFVTVEATLPLGLNITLRERGDLRGSFVVEDVLPGGFGEASGSIQTGDVLQALTTRVTSMGVTTFDSGVTQSTQHLVDASFLSSLTELVEAIGTNVNGDIILVLERPATTSVKTPP